VIRWFLDNTTRRSYEILDRQYFDGGFVQQHVLRAGRSADTSIEMRVCIVIKVDTEGRITRVDEYFDPADMAPLLRSTT
jgi:ketosteroid isomerase-like protein